MPKLVGLTEKSFQAVSDISPVPPFAPLTGVAVDAHFYLFVLYYI